MIILAQWIAAFGPVVFLADPGAAHQKVAECLAVPRQILAGIVDDFHIDAVDRAALIVLQGKAPFGVPVVVLGLERIDRAERAHFGHAPGVNDLYAIIFFEAADHRRRAGGSADDGALERAEGLVVLFHEREQAEPYRRHARGDRDFFLLEQLEHAGAIEPRSREYQLGADHGRAIGQAPGVDVEHRHHRQDDVARGNVQRVRHARRVAVNDGAAVAVEHALGIARRARGVAQRRCGALVELRPVEFIGMRVDQFFVAQHIGQLRRRHVRLVGHEDPALHQRALVGNGFDQRHESQVDKYIAIFGMVGDVDDLLGEQPGIDRMRHGANTRRRVIGLEMPEAVPRHGGNPVVHFYAEGGQCIGELAGAAVSFAVGVAMDGAAFHQAGYDFGIAVVAIRVPDQRRDQQRGVHHEALHGAAPVIIRFARILAVCPARTGLSVEPDAIAFVALQKSIGAWFATRLQPRCFANRIRAVQ